MFKYVLGLYVLLTSHVPVPVNTMLFGIATLAAYTLLSPQYDAFAAIGLILPVLCAVFGYVTVVALNIPATAERYERENGRVIGPRAFAIPFILCALAIFAPTLAWAQHGISIILALSALVFLVFSMCSAPNTRFPLFGEPWTEAQQNAANWHIARLVALLLGNEMVARTGTATDWVIAMCIGPIIVHYLMHWTIIVTHPYENRGDDY